MRFPRSLAFLLPRARRLAIGMVDRARVAAAAGRHADAAALYEEALRLRPGRAAWHVQAGHMWKDADRLDDAARHYAIADRLRPGDPDLALQYGHLHKLAGRIEDAERAYRRAAALRPGSPAVRELAHLAACGWRGRDGASPARPDAAMRFSGIGDPTDPVLSPHHVPPPPVHAAVEIRRLGRIAPDKWGDGRILHGVEAIRGFCIAADRIVEVQVIMGGLTLHRGPVRGPYPIHGMGADDPARKYVFNIWIDFARFVPGRYAIEVRMLDADGGTRAHHDRVVVHAPVPESIHPGSDALIVADPADRRSVDEQVADRPSIVRPAVRTLLPHPPRAILVQRTDQLGDMVASVPALRRLRGLFPDARIVGLLTAANADLAATLDLFDETVVIDFPDDPVARRRLMPMDEQRALAARLAAFGFDVAIDLAASGVSRSLLRLSGAPFTAGMGDASWPWLSAGFDFHVRDPVTRLDRLSHASKVLAMVEALGAALHSPSHVIRRDDLRRGMLVPLGLPDDAPFVLLHAGARIGFSHWPHYPALARMLRERTGLHVVMLTEDGGMRAALPPALSGDDRFLLIDRRLPFDALDALLSFATVMVGNDSGPKHLASLRGTPVVTLFTNRIDHREWGQDLTGVVMTRKVPCAGCQLFHDPEECGRDFACIAGIRPDEVLDAMRPWLPVA